MQKEGDMIAKNQGTPEGFCYGPYGGRRLRGFMFVLLGIGLVLALNAPVLAQQNHTLFFMDEVPQASALNPAYASRCTYIGLPLISSFHGNIAHTGFSYNQVFPEADGARIVDFHYLEQRLHRLDLFTSGVHVDLFSFGLHRRKYFFSFRITDKVEAMGHYPNALFELPWRGNSPFVGETAIVKRAGGNFNYYREFSVSASTWISDDLRVGLRPKLLFGKLNINTRQEKFLLTTRSEDYRIEAEGSYRINASLPVVIRQDSSGMIRSVRLKDGLSWQDVVLNAKNPGLAVDIGAVYVGWDNWTLYGSLLDLGVVRWADELNNFEATHRFRFEGLDEGDLNTAGDYGQIMRDSLRDSYTVERTHKPYYTFRPLHTYLGMTYQLNGSMAAGLLEHNILYRGRIFPSLTLSLNSRLNDWATLAVSYSYNQYSFRNLGAAFSVQSDKLQFYAGADNLLAVDVLNVRNINLRWGLNIFFGCGNQPGEKAPGRQRSASGCYWIKKQQQQNKILPDKHKKDKAW